MSRQPHPRWTQQVRMINDIRNNQSLCAQLLQAANNDPKVANRLALALVNNDTLRTQKDLQNVLQKFKDLLQNNIQKRPELKPDNNTAEARLFEIMNGGANNLLFNGDLNAAQLNSEMQEEIEKEINEEEEKQSPHSFAKYLELTLPISAAALAIFDEKKEATAREELALKGLSEKNKEYSHELAEKLIHRPEPTPSNNKEESLAERLNP